MMIHQFDSFSEQVLSKGVEAVLPRNLSDDWLHYLVTQVNKYRCDEDDADTMSIIAAVELIIEAKRGLSLQQLSDDEFEAYTSEYGTELLLQMVHRNTEFRISSASIDNILSGREVAITRRQEH